MNETNFLPLAVAYVAISGSDARNPEPAKKQGNEGKRGRPDHAPFQVELNEAEDSASFLAVEYEIK